MFGAGVNSGADRSHAYLLYDSRCGPCTRFMKIVKMLDLHRKLTPVSIHQKETVVLVDGMLSSGRLKSSFHVLEISQTKTSIYSAGDGLIRLTRYTPGGAITYSMVSHTKFLRQFFRWGYFQATRLRAASKSCFLSSV
jgi:predicted DCC family thiol-disulfide oxidoreductase YuxK